MSEPPDSPFVTSLAHHAADPFRLLVESVEDYAIFMLDPAGRVASWNPGAERIYGYQTAEIVGQPVEQLYHLEDAEIGKPAVARLAALSSGFFGAESELARKDGTAFCAEITTSNLKDYFGNHAGFSMVTRDITERRNAELRIRQERDLHEAILSSLPGVYYMYDESGHFIRWNKQFEEITGYTTDEINSLHPLDLFVGENRVKVAEAIERVFRTGFGQTEALFLSKTGVQIPYYFNGIRAEIEGKVCLLGMGIDITDQVRAQQELRANDLRMRQAARAGNVGLWDFDLKTNKIYYSPELKRQLGYEDHEIGDELSEWEDRLHPDDKAESLQALVDFVANPATYRYEREFRLLHRDGSYRRILSQASLLFDENNAEPIRMLGSHVDVTEQRRLEQQIRQAQKMEAVGQLAAGVAHDFNNLVTVINGYSDLVLSSGALEEPIRSQVAEIYQAGIRAGNLTRQLLSFCRRQAVEPKHLNPNLVVSTTEKMLLRLLGDGVTLETVLAPDAGTVRADQGQLELVLVNLAVNARDAMPGGGTLTISTRNTGPGDGALADEPDLPAGEYVLIAVSDTGTGIDAETRAHIFEPFFTTKAEGFGTGLGLATLKSIVGQADGHIFVHSDMGSGTTFKIYLPRLEEPSIAPPEEPLREERPGGHETVLLVEDEDALRALELAILRASGYTVLEAANGAAGLSLAQSHTGPIDVLVVDLVLPDANGRELAARLAESHPSTRVILMSGYNDEEVPGENGVVPYLFLQKPFSPASLASAVRRVLDSAR